MTAPLLAISRTKSVFEKEYDQLRSKANPFANSVVASHKDWLVEQPAARTRNPVPQTPSCPFKDQFVSRPHVNLLVSSKDEHIGILTVATQPEALARRVTREFVFGASYKALFTHPKGADVFLFHDVPASASTANDVGSALLSFLVGRLVDKSFSLSMVSSSSAAAFDTQLLTFEQETQRLTSLKIAVLYAKDKQTDMDDILLNKPSAHSSFYKFMDQFAQRLEAKSSSEDEGSSVSTYFSKWNDVFIKFHVAPALNSRQQHDLIENDLGVIIFHEKSVDGPSFLPFPAAGAGASSLLFAVVQHRASDGDKYRLGTFQRPSIGTYEPQCPPSSAVFSAEDVRTFLVTKMYNGVLRAKSLPPLDEVASDLRRLALHEIIGKSLGEIKSTSGSKKPNLRLSLAPPASTDGARSPSTGSPNSSSANRDSSDHSPSGDSSRSSKKHDKDSIKK